MGRTREVSEDPIHEIIFACPYVLSIGALTERMGWNVALMYGHTSGVTIGLHHSDP